MGNILKTTALLTVLTLLFVLVGGALGGRQGAVLALVVAAALNLGAWWFSDRIVLASYRAVRIDEAEAPELHAMIDLLARKLGIPKPAVYRVPMAAPNAFATGRGPRHAAVAITDGLLRLMPTDEIEAVLAHELGHVVHRDTLTSSIAATLAGAIGMLARMGGWGLLGARDRRRDGSGLLGLIAVVLAPLSAMLVQLAISRSREYHADEFSARTLGTGEPLARALARLEGAATAHPTDVPPSSAHLFVVNPLGGLGGFLALFRTHPPTAERIRHLHALGPPPADASA